MKNKKYIISVVVATICLIIASIIMKMLLNISIHSADFIIGWIGASIYYAVLIRINNKENNKSNDNINVHIDNINNKLEQLEIERNYYKTELEYMKTKYDNFKSEEIVQRSINSK